MIVKNNYKELSPFIGSNYDSKSHKKLLLVGESHYLPENSTIHLDANKWYSGNSSNLSSTEKAWMNTNDLIEWATETNFSEKGHTMYRQLHSVLKESGLMSNSLAGNNEYILDEVAFLNYFQRPANEGNSLKDIYEPIDGQIAWDNFVSAVTEIKPDIAIITSKFANTKAEEFEIWNFLESVNCSYCYTPHPTSSWWNRPLNWKSFEGRTGKKQFLHLLEKHHFLT